MKLTDVGVHDFPDPRTPAKFFRCQVYRALSNDGKRLEF